MDKEALIFKILTVPEWQQFQRDGIFQGSALDKTDGFIHISAVPQVQGTLEKWYTNEEPLVMVALDPANLKDHIKWEVSRGGAEFPHYYASLTMKQVEAYYNLSADKHGRYDFSRIL